MKLAKIILGKNENKCRCSPCTLCIVLFSILFTINVGIATYFHWYLKKKMLLVKQQSTKLIKWEKSNKLTLKIELNIFIT